MVVVHILVQLVQIILRVTADALTAGLGLALIALLAGATLIALIVVGFSSLGTFAIFRRSKSSQSHKDRPTL